MIRNVIVYFITLLGLAWFSIMYNTYHTSLLFFSWLIFPFCLLILLIYSTNKIKLKIDSKEATVKVEDDFDLILYIDNKGRIPIYRMDILIEYCNVLTGEKKKEVIRCTLDKKNQQTVKTLVQTKVSGIFTFKILSFRNYDFLEVFSLKRKLKHEVKVLSLPKYLELFLDATPIREDSVAEEGDVVQKKGEDPSEIFGIRDYMDGDRESRMHHKLSFKYNTIMIKEYSSLDSKKNLIIFEPPIHEKNIVAADLLHYELHVLHFFLRHFEREGRNTSLCYLLNGQVISFNITEKEDIDRILEQVLLDEEIRRTSLQKSQENILSLISVQVNMKQYKTITYITTEVDRKGLYNLYHENEGRQLQLVYVNDLTNHPNEGEIQNSDLENLEFTTIMDHIQILEYEIQELLL